MCYQWQNISWLHKYSFPPTPFQGKHTNTWAVFSFWMYIHFYTKFKVVYAVHQSKTREKRLQNCIRCHEVQTPKGVRCVLRNSVVNLVLQTPVHAILFFVCRGICNVHRHTCIHSYRLVCLHIHTERRRRHTSSWLLPTAVIHFAWWLYWASW